MEKYLNNDFDTSNVDNLMKEIDEIVDQIILNVMILLVRGICQSIVYSNEIK